MRWRFAHVYSGPKCSADCVILEVGIVMVKVQALHGKL